MNKKTQRVDGKCRLLPSRVLTHLLSWCTHMELLRSCVLTCKAWKQVVMTAWQQHERVTIMMPYADGPAEWEKIPIAKTKTTYRWRFPPLMRLRHLCVWEQPQGV